MHHAWTTPPPDVAICIPARDEAAELPTLFEALDVLDAHPVHICLLLDGCTDGSAAIADVYRRRSRHHVRIGHAAACAPNAGLARHQAMAMGLDALAGADGLLLSTDADSGPAPDWVTAMTAGLAVADIVTGRIVRSGERPSRLQDRLEIYYDALFSLRRRLDPVPWEATATHHYAGGANFGISAAAYRAIGGFAPLPAGEDARLVDDAARGGWRVRRDAACVVRTSDRRDGRTGAGLALALRELDGGDAAAVRVTHPADAAWQYRMHAVARAAFEQGRPDLVAVELGLTPDHALGVARDCPNAEAFAMRVVPAAPNGMRNVTLAVAEAELDRLTAARRAA